MTIQPCSSGPRHAPLCARNLLSADAQTLAAMVDKYLSDRIADDGLNPKSPDRPPCPADSISGRVWPGSAYKVHCPGAGEIKPGRCCLRPAPPGWSVRSSVPARSPVFVKPLGGLAARSRRELNADPHHSGVEAIHIPHAEEASVLEILASCNSVLGAISHFVAGDRGGPAPQESQKRFSRPLWGGPRPSS